MLLGFSRGQNMYKRSFLVVVTLSFCLIFGFHPDEVHSRKLKLIKPGDLFPETSLLMPADPRDREYLGLLKGEFFTLKEIKTDLVVVEILSIYCLSCRKQMAPYNKLFNLIENDPTTRGRIKIIGIAVGNGEALVKKFRKKYKIRFPIIPDPEFALHRAIGGGRTPFTIYVRQDPDGQTAVVADTHLGKNTKYERLFQELRTMVTVDLAAIRQDSKLKEADTIVVKPILTELELQEKVKGLFSTFTGKVAQFQKVTLKNAGEIYIGLIEHEGTSIRLFARVTSRPATCDLCHDIHFIYVFDSSGEVLRFEPIQLTKGGNKTWNEADLAKMRERVLGRYIFTPYSFNPEVDAVSSATITSAIIIDAIFRGEDLLQELREKGLI